MFAARIVEMMSLKCRHRRVTIVEGDVLDAETLRKAMRGKDVVYANLAADIKRQAQSIIDVRPTICRR